MGCFSYLCKKSGKPALSTSFDGSPCRIFLLLNGKVIEEMHGNYDSYGRVFGKDGKSLKWSLEWSDCVDLHFNDNEGDGFAIILDSEWDGEYPTTISEDDPNQGWGTYDEDEEGEDGDLLGCVSDNMFPKVEEPYHKVHSKVTEEDLIKEDPKTIYDLPLKVISEVVDSIESNQKQFSGIVPKRDIVILDMIRVYRSLKNL